MLRTALVLLLVGSAAGCGARSTPDSAAAEPPPLPPSSGTPIGYLLDNATQLALTDEQIDKLRKLDVSLAARNDSIDTQLREIERPEEAPPPAKGEPPAKVNMAPGAQPMTTTADASKLHQARAQNNTDALVQAFGWLDADQQTKAKRLLDDRGIAAPKLNPPPPGTGGTPETPQP